MLINNIIPLNVNVCQSVGACICTYLLRRAIFPLIITLQRVNDSMNLQSYQ